MKKYNHHIHKVTLSIAKNWHNDLKKIQKFN